jgi:hypothetical protein
LIILAFGVLGDDHVPVYPDLFSAVRWQSRWQKSPAVASGAAVLELSHYENEEEILALQHQVKAADEQVKLRGAAPAIH